jgi:hypothetical protein
VSINIHPPPYTAPCVAGNDTSPPCPGNFTEQLYGDYNLFAIEPTPWFKKKGWVPPHDTSTFTYGISPELI